MLFLSPRIMKKLAESLSCYIPGTAKHTPPSLGTYSITSRNTVTEQTCCYNNSDLLCKFQDPKRQRDATLIFLFCHTTVLGILVPQPGVERGPLAVRGQSPNQIAREFLDFLNKSF